jgi:hypothetical protein
MRLKTLTLGEMMMKLADHGSIHDFWSNLTWTSSGSRYDLVKPLDSVLQKVTLITGGANNNNYLQLTRAQDGATAVLQCYHGSLFGNLDQTLRACIGKTIREIGDREVRADLR